MGRSKFIKSLLLGVSILATGCSKAGFNSSKQDVLSGTSVLEAPQSLNGSEYGGLPGNDGSTPSIPTLNMAEMIKQAQQQAAAQAEEAKKAPTNFGAPGKTEIQVSRQCSDSMSQNSTNFKEAIKKSLSMSLLVNNVVCSQNNALIARLIMQTNISVSDLRSACPEKIPNIGSINIAFQWTKHGNSGTTILYARNTNTSDPQLAADEYCTSRISPLVIHMASDLSHPRPVSLSSIDQGIEFDMLGARASHAKVKIGWFTNHDYRLLALPNANGRVGGIDELFGDNTQGPDGTFADNGYAALAKYDGTSADGHFRLAKADGYIDQRDPVFAKLRLWHDRNFNGRAEASELQSLSSAGISYIDLAYSVDYAEEDQYGNQTKMKSVVGYVSGAMDLIFDLWFIYRF